MYALKIGRVLGIFGGLYRKAGIFGVFTEKLSLSSYRKVGIFGGPCGKADIFWGPCRKHGIFGGPCKNLYILGLYTKAGILCFFT
jgi:hypothetical protein